MTVWIIEHKFDDTPTFVGAYTTEKAAQVAIPGLLEDRDFFGGNAEDYRIREVAVM